MRGTTNLKYYPEKHIELITASSNNQIIGRALFCLDGDTEIKTTKGDFKIKDLVDKEINVLSIDNSGNLVTSDTCTVKPTIKTNEEYNIELEDGTVIKCTPNHRLMLKDGTYKEVQYLTEEDELANVRLTYSKIASIKKVILDSPKQYYDVIEANPYNNFLIKTNDSYIVSHNCNFTDK